jgi:hypothetical protein
MESKGAAMRLNGMTSRDKAVIPAILLVLMLCLAPAAGLFGQSLDIPAKDWGLSFGNSK